MTSLGKEGREVQGNDETGRKGNMEERSGDRTVLRQVEREDWILWNSDRDRRREELMTG